MAYIENYFNFTLSSLTTATHTITGLTSATSSTSVSYVSEEASLLFAKAIYQTLKDGGLDATLDESTYKITVLGFSFFVLGVSAASSITRLYMRIYPVSSSTALDTSTSSYTYMNTASKSATVAFYLKLRCNEDAFTLNYSGQNVNTMDSQAIAVCRGVSLITGEYAWTYGSYINYSNKVVLSSDIYTANTLNSSYDENFIYDGAGLNTDSLISCAPTIVWYKSIYIPSIIGASKSCITGGQYYQIGNEIYWAAGYKTSTSSSTAYNAGGACPLIRI